MRNLISWMAVILLFVAPQIAMAQHRGAGGTSGSKTSGTPPQETDSAIKDVQRTFALQATEEQTAQFQSWKENTKAVKDRIQKLRDGAVPNDAPSRLNELRAAIEKSSSGYHDFLGSLTEAQQKGLKKPIQQLRKANDKLAKAAATLLHELGQDNGGSKRSSELEKAETAVGDLLDEQKRFAAEISISSQ